MKLWALILRSGMRGSATWLAMALMVGLMANLLRVAVLWAFVDPDGGPAAALGLPGFLILLGLLYWGQWLVQNKVNLWFTEAVAGLRRSLPMLLLRLEPLAWERFPQSALRQSLANVPTQLNTLAGSLAGAISLAILAVVTSMYLLWMYWPLGGIACFAYICMAYYLFQTNNDITAFEMEARVRDERLRDGIADLALGHKELLLNPGKAEQVFQDVIVDTIKLRAAARASVRAKVGNFTLTYELVDAALVAISIACAVLLPHPQGSLDFRVALLLVYILPFAMFQVLPMLSSGEAAATQIEEIERDLAAAGARTARDADAPAALPEDFAFETLELRDYTYSHSGGRGGFRLGPLSLRIERGSITFITGENGAGKSTLLKLITGLYPPRSGAALLNGTRVDLRAARDLFAFVAAEHVLFERLFGYRATDPHRVEALLADFGLADITHYRDGRFTRLALSSGQKKRVGLVVALLEDKPVLVLDEWTAEQDPPMRRRFYQDILPALCKAGKAVILVTHDDRNLDACDQLVTMRDGLIRSSVVSQLGRSQ